MSTQYSREKIDYYRKREELRDTLSKKYQRQFGPKYQSIIFSEVDRYVINSKFTEEDLKQLEASIKDKIADIPQKKSIISHEPDLKYNIKNRSNQMNDNQNYESYNNDNQMNSQMNNQMNNQMNKQVNQNENPATVNTTNVHKSSAVINNSSYNPFKEHTDYHGLHTSPQNTDWSKLQVYKAQLHEKDLEHEKQVANQKRDKLKNTFAEQFKEKEDILRKEREERQKYIELQNQQYQEYLIDEERKKKELSDRAEIEKEERKQQALESRNRKLAEQEKERQIARKMAEQLEQQYTLELTEEKARKKQEKEDLMRFILSNDEKLKEKQKLLELDRKKEIEQMKETAKVEELREQQRVMENNQRLAKISERLNIVMESDTMKEQQQKIKIEEENRKKAIAFKLKADQDKEIFEKNVRDKRTKEELVVLSQQIREKQLRKQAEKEEEIKFSQSYIEKNRKELENEREQERLRRQKALENAKYLEYQMNLPKNDLDNMSRRELELNKQLLNRATNGNVQYQPGLHL